MTDTQEMRAPEIVVITVQFRNQADTASLLASLSKLRGASSCEVIVVDNAPEESGPADTPGVFPFNVRWLSTSNNLYYWGGAAYALRSLFPSTSSLPRWVIICNNDVLFDDPAFLEHLRALDPSEHPIVAPRIVSSVTQRDQNPLLATAPAFFTRLKWRIYDLDFLVAQTMLRLHRSLVRLSVFRGRESDSGAASAGRSNRIYAPHGALVILSKEFFERGGALDTSIPMFAEEMTLAATAKRLGVPVWHFPTLRVSHNEHSTTGAELTKAKYQMERAARRHYYKTGQTAPERDKL